jgi:DNA-binding response OmpR family regulator
MRILLVEDEPGLQELWGDVLRELGYAIDLAGTLCEAQACFAAKVYDLVITDWWLPDGDGCVVADWAVALGQSRGHEWIFVPHARRCRARP